MRRVNRVLSRAAWSYAVVLFGCSQDARGPVGPAERDVEITASLDNSGVASLTPGITGARGPRVTERIAFERNGLIYVMNGEGSPPTSVASGAAPSWSPDGTRIAFIRSDEIHVINADGSGLRRLGPGFRPEWSPDGTRIVFLVRRDDGMPAGLSLMNADGTSVTSLNGDLPESSCDTETAYYATWSPDGTRIAFATSFGIDALDVCLMNADGSGVRSLAADPSAFALGGRPAWSPDGSRIAVMSYARTTNQAGNTTVIKSYPVDGVGAGEELFRFPMGPVGVGSLHWTPSGKALVFGFNAPMSTCCSYTSRISVLSVKTRTIRQIVPDAPSVQVPRDYNVTVARNN